MRHEREFTAPVGKIYTQALREEALLYEKNEQFSRAQRLRALADKLDRFCAMKKVQ